MPSKKIVELVKNLAESSLHPITKIGCIIYKSSGIKSSAVNTQQFIGYRREEFNFSPTRHAEMNALHNVPRESLKGSDLIVYRLDKLGRIGSAKPCGACIVAIYKAGIRRLHYTSADGGIKTITVSKINLEEWEREAPVIDN